MPSATASHPTRSPLQSSSSCGSASAMSVGSMRSKGPWVSPSRDRALSFYRPPSFEVGHGELGGPVLWKGHRTVAVACPHLRISVARSTLAA